MRRTDMIQKHHTLHIKRIIFGWNDSKAPYFIHKMNHCDVRRLSIGPPGVFQFHHWYEIHVLSCPYYFDSLTRTFVVNMQVFDSSIGFLSHFEALASSSANPGLGMGVHSAKPLMYPGFKCEGLGGTAIVRRTLPKNGGRLGSQVTI